MMLLPVNLMIEKVDALPIDVGSDIGTNIRAASPLVQRLRLIRRCRPQRGDLRT
jgi:hypothetical protein